MKTCGEISNFINQNGYYDNYSDFSVSISKIVDTLKDGEEVLFAAGTRSITNATHVMCQKGAVVAITNQRLIYAGKSAAMFSKNIYVKSVSVEQTSDILYNEKSGGISIDFRNEVVIFWTDKRKIVEVFNKVTAAIDYIKNAKNTPSVISVSTTDELKKYKELLDSGVITQEEFDAKKKQLLGL